jgi:hypothetical protein
VFDFTLLSHLATLEFAKPEDIGGDLGHTYSEDLRIRLRENLGNDVTGATFLHELIHLIEGMLSLKFEEHEIDGLALGLYSFLKENQGLAEALFWNRHTLEEEEDETGRNGNKRGKGMDEPLDGEYCSWAGVPHNVSPYRRDLYGIEPAIKRRR